MKTTKETCEHLFVDAMARGNAEGVVERQEARGQASFCKSEDIPVEYSPGSGFNDETLIKMGIELGEPYEDDPIFRLCKLPEGWSKRGSNHSMWSCLLDDKGRQGTREGKYFL
jgi:hypothetical protein